LRSTQKFLAGRDEWRAVEPRGETSPRISFFDTPLDDSPFLLLLLKQVEDYTIVVPDAGILSQLCGTNDNNLRLIEEYLGVPVFTKGNELAINGDSPKVCREFRHIIDRITDEVQDGAVADTDLLTAIFNVDVPRGGFKAPPIIIPGGMKRVYAKTPHQEQFIAAMRSNDLVFCVGPAGSGKTFLAIAHALEQVLSRKKNALVLTRPVVEAGESLGFLPGDLEQKISPYLRPLYDAMSYLLGRETVRRLSDNGIIEVAPLAYMRGRTLHNSVVLLDEAQNTTIEQMKMFLTRIGEGSSVCVTGDITQTDLPAHTMSGLVHALSILRSIPSIDIIQMEAEDVVRSRLVKKIVEAYEKSKK
jgi:phosphate starvation-inducible PhoH-like protein